MNYSFKNAEKSTVEIKITFGGEEWNGAIDKAYQRTRGRFAVNGFRKGKAPRNVIEHAYGKGVFYEDALNVLFQEHYGKIVENEKEHFRVVGDPSISVDELTDEKVVMTITSPVYPEVKIEKYTGMKITEVAYNVTDDEIESEVQKLLDRKAEKVEVTDRAAKDGDTVNIDFLGTVNGVKFDGGEAEGYDLTLGSHAFIPGFEEQVVGMNIGDKKDVCVKFPDNYQAEELKGKDAVFAVTLHKITGKVLPELTDEFVKANAGADTVKDYREKVRARLQKQADDKSRDETENNIIDAIAEHTSAEIPQAMIETGIDSLVQRFEYQLMYQGLKLDDYLSFLKITKEDFRKQYEEQAKKNVLNQLVISEIIKREKFVANEEEVDAKIAEQAESVGKKAEEYKKTMDPRQFDYIRSDIVITKLFDFLKANNEMSVEAK